MAHLQRSRCKRRNRTGQRQRSARRGHVDADFDLALQGTGSIDSPHGPDGAGPFTRPLVLARGELYIGTVDIDGVSLAAIQGLYEVVREQQTQIDELSARLAAQEEATR